MVDRVIAIIIDCFFKRYGYFCDWVCLSFDQRAWLELYANKAGLTLERIKERWFYL